MLMLRQLRAELYKVAHSKWILFSIVCCTFLVIFYGLIERSLMIMVAGNLANPEQSIGFFWMDTMASTQVAVVRSALAGTISVWPVLLVFCVMGFSQEMNQRTDDLLVAHGGDLSKFYISKMVVSFAFCLALYFVFVLVMFFIAAIRFGYAITAEDVGVLISSALLNAGVLLVFMFLASATTLFLRNSGITTLLFCIVPLIGIVLFQTNFRVFDTLAAPVQVLAKMNPIYFWSNTCSLRHPPDLMLDLLFFTLTFVALGIFLCFIVTKRQARR